MSYAFYRFGTIRVLLSRPTATGYGSAVAEILNAFHLARHLDAAVFFVKPRRPLNHAIFGLRCPQVQMLRTGGPALRLLWAMTRGRSDVVRQFRISMVTTCKSYMKRPDISRDRKRAVKRIVRRIAPSGPPRQHPALAAALRTIDFRREYAERPLIADLSPREADAAEKAARELGIVPERPIVTLHVRESGYKVSLGLPERPTDVMRNASILRYGPSLQYLTERGYQVVRLGDATSAPVAVRGVVDLALSGARTEALELWCQKRSRFFIASDSGPYMAAILLGVPTLAVNVTALLGGDPLREGDLYILKHVRDNGSGRMLSLLELLDPEYLINFRAPGRYTHIENTSDEILEAVREMDAALEHRPSPSVAQQTFDQMLRALASCATVGTWRQDAGLPPGLYVGRGRVADSFARPLLAASRERAGA